MSNKVNSSEEKNLLAIEKIVERAKGKITPEDAASATGLSINEVQDALSRLVELYECRVTMNPEKGSVQFIFPFPFQKRGRKTFKEIATAILAALWKAFQVVYKAAIGIILIVYTVIFIVILIAVMFGTSRDRDDNPIGDIIGGLLRAIFEAMFWTSVLQPVQYEVDRSGYKYRTYQKDKNKGKNFIKSVYSFVFGPDRPVYDYLSDAKEAIAFIRKNNGKITAGHIIALTGVNYEEAERRLAEYSTKYKGELHVVDDEILVADFTQLLNTTNPPIEGGKIEFYVDEIEPPYQITGNTGGRNSVIIAMNTFNLIMSFVLYPVASQYFSSGVAFFISVFPLVFSITFFLIPLARIPYVLVKEKKRKLNILRKKIFDIIVSADVPLTAEQIIEYAKINQSDKANAMAVLEKLILDLEGKIDLDENGKALIHFPRLMKELKVK